MTGHTCLLALLGQTVHWFPKHYLENDFTWPQVSIALINALCREETVTREVALLWEVQELLMNWNKSLHTEFNNLARLRSLRFEGSLASKFMCAPIKFEIMSFSLSATAFALHVEILSLGSGVRVYALLPTEGYIAQVQSSEKRGNKQQYNPQLLCLGLRKSGIPGNSSPWSANSLKRLNFHRKSFPWARM